MYEPKAGVQVFTKCTTCPELVHKHGIRYVKQPLADWAKEQMNEGNALLFIGACGIAVRAVAPNITDKLHDSPVLVMDEKGRYVIPVLSGHMGGANELALMLAEKTGAEPVITTATDLNDRFAVDLFAKKNRLFIVNREGIARVSSKVLAGQGITMAVETGHFREDVPLPEGITMAAYPPAQYVDIVVTSEKREFDTAILLRPREYVIGIGCKRGKEIEPVRGFIMRALQELGITGTQVAMLASIDRKREEASLLTWSRQEQIPFVTYSAAELQKVEGNVNRSDFVREKVGVDNVCERAALRACEGHGKLVYEKHAENGMTIAVARREWKAGFL
ncbi:MAG: cobalamin biosynthesis protein [Lachnospiraceae bacterium]|nr:cobalamin biosynthesis protein [Lachnospiraceae bacterium]